jgi:hypothetical protein
MSCRIGGTCILVLGLATQCWGEPDALRFFSCGVVQFFGEACTPPVAPEERVPAVSSLPPVFPSREATLPAPVPAPTPADTTPTAESLPSLFPPETVSPDMPPLLLQLLQEPTEARARAFLAWQRARLQRLQEVQALLRALQTTEADPVPPSQERRNPRARP